MQPAPPCSAPACWWQTRESGLLLRWELQLGNNMWVLFIYFFLLIMLPSEIPKLPTDPPVRGFPGVCKLLLLQDSLPGMGLHPQLFCLSFYLLYFVLPPFKDNMLTLSVPGILHQHSEVVLWNLLSVQISFNEFVGEKVVLPSYSSGILGLLPAKSIYLHTVCLFSYDNRNVERLQ